MSLKSSSPPTAEKRHVPLSVFERAKLRVGIGVASPRVSQKQNPPSVGNLLEQFHGLKGGEKTAFFRANAEALKAEEKALPAMGKKSINPALASKKPSAAKSPVVQISPSGGAAADALLEKFYSMKGAQKTAFFRANKQLLKAAAALVAIRETTAMGTISPAKDEASAVQYFEAAHALAPSQGAGDTLLGIFHSLSGTAKTVFFRANHAGLKVAAML